MVLKAVDVDEVAKGGRTHPEKLQYLEAEREGRTRKLGRSGH